MDDVIPVTLKSTLERVCRKFFNRDAAHKSPKHQRFVELYQATFEKDFEVRKEGGGFEKGGECVRAAQARAATRLHSLKGLHCIASVATGPNTAGPGATSYQFTSAAQAPKI